MTGTQEFERVLDGSDKSVASFEHEKISLIKRAQHFCTRRRPPCR